jgi:ABC-type multidrug transport system fused ATPase/permease subunit
MDANCVVEQGTNARLLAHGGHYGQPLFGAVPQL